VLKTGVAQVWLRRERVEKEAADVFFRLAEQLRAINAHPQLFE